MIEALVRDLRFAARGLRRTPAFSAAAILTLAVGIGTTTAVFSVVYGVLLRPLPFPTADRLVRIVQLLPSRSGGPPGRAGLTPDQITEWRATSRTLAEIGSYSHTSLSLTGVPQPIRLNGASISVPLFRALGVPPMTGRGFVEDDEMAGNEHVVVLSHGLWSARFGAAREMVGRTLTLGGREYRVIGVMPRGFGFPSLASPRMSMNADGALADAPEFWIPMVKQARPAGPATGGITLVPAFGLLRPGVTAAQAAAELSTLMPARVKDRFAIELTNPRDEETRQVRGVLLVFQAAVLFVLFIACANVTNLLLARAASRRHELAVRLALGASRMQIARYAISESAIIGACGGAAGILLAYHAVVLVRALPPYVVPRLADVRVDAVALALTSLVAAGAGIAVGILTAFRILRTDGGRQWQPQSRGASHHQPSRVLVIAETAAGVMLLAGAVLLLGSFIRLTQVPRGFDARDVYAFRVSLPQRLQAAPAQHAFHDRLSAALRASQGVESVGAMGGSLTGAGITFSVTIAGRAARDEVSFQTIMPGVFAALRIPLRGRDFAPGDRAATPSTAIVNETFARRHFAGIDPVGQSIDFLDWRSLEIIGVVGDTRPGELTGAMRSAIYLPTQTTVGFGSPTYVVRGTGVDRLLPTIRAAAVEIDPDAVVFDATTLDALLARQVTTPKFYGFTASAFAAVAVILAALGLYGVLSYSVSARTRELGIRIAIGATPRRVIAGVMRQAIVTVLAGVAIGLAGAFWSSRFLESVLFGVQPYDPATFAAVAAIFLAIALLAAYVPARRATLIDPVAALRAE